MKVLEAMEFAMEKHTGQMRQYSGEPYIAHLAEVAAYVHAVGGSEDAVCAAWLHDVVEDQPVKFAEISEAFGDRVASYVLDLTNPPKVEGQDKEDKLREILERLGNASSAAQTVKVADIIANCKSLRKHDPERAKVYFEEKRRVLDVLVRANPRLLEIARGILENE